jgi:hypothetical protein
MAVLAVVLAVHGLGGAPPALAGGTHLQPVRDRYEAGEVATLVGYTSGGQLGWVQDGPFYAYLVDEGTTLWASRRVPPESLPLGPLTVEARGSTLRVSLSFRLPDQLVPGVYTVSYCNDPCTTGLGDLIGASVAVGVDPPRPVQREWLPDDPEITNLAEDALLTGPGGSYTAGDLRTGRVTAPAGWGTDERPRGGHQRPDVSPPSTLAASGPVVDPSPVAVPADGAPWLWALLVVGSALAVCLVLAARPRVRAATGHPATTDTPVRWRPSDSEVTTALDPYLAEAEAPRRRHVRVRSKAPAS